MSEYGHGHGHDHAAGGRQRLIVVLAISVTIMVVQVIGAVLSGSLALLADAGHVLTDVAGLTLAVVAASLARRPSTPRRTWGFHRAEVLAAAAQAAVLLAVGGLVLFEAVQRMISPTPVEPRPMLLFGLLSLAGNLIAVAVLVGARTANLNLRAAFLEVVADALGAVAVIAAATVVLLTGWVRADAAASLLIGGLILPRTWRLLRESVDVLLESTPRHLDLTHVRDHLLGSDSVLQVHDLHASQVATGLPVLSAHVVVSDECFHDGRLPALLDELQQCLTGHFDVAHSTLQFEAAQHSAHEPSAHA